jgi:OOP family OmpA-OmpF porin
MQARSFAAAAAAFAAAALLGRTAAADEEGWSSDALIPAERGSRWFFVESLDLRGHGRMALGAVATYSYRSVAVRDDRGDVVASPVRNQVVLHQGASFVFADRIRLGFDVPLQIVADGNSAVVDGVRFAPAADEAAVGDVRLAGDVRLFGRHAEGFTGAIGMQLFVPAGSPSSFTGDGEPHVRPRFMLAYEHRSVALAAMTGVHLRGRDEDWARGHIGSEVFVGLAGGVLLAQKRISIGPELIATTVVSEGWAFRARATPVEVLLGTRWEVLPKVRAAVGGGVGITHAYGAPVARALFALEWVPDDPLPPPTPKGDKVTPPDRDGDGVPDPDDACGFVPGEKSAFPERNGCPPPEPEPEVVAP